MTPPKPKSFVPVNEWVLTSDMDTVRVAITGMLNKRGQNPNSIAAKIGASTSWMSLFLSGKQPNLRLDSLIRIIEAGDFEIVIREPSAQARTRRRLDAFKKERGKAVESKAERAMDEIVERDDPDRELKIRMLDGMTDPDNRASLEELFKSLRDQ